MSKLNITIAEETDKPVDHKRIIMKTITWRIVATLLTFGIVYFISHEVILATGFSIIDNVVKGVMYYGHEYTWDSFSKHSIFTRS